MNETLQTARNLSDYTLLRIEVLYEKHCAVAYEDFDDKLNKILEDHKNELDRRKALALEYAQGTLPDRRKTPRLIDHGKVTEVSES